MRSTVRPSAPDSAGQLGVVVTGGTSGLGLAMANEFLEYGDRVVICGRNRERLDAAIGVLRAKNRGATIFGMVCDVSSMADVAAFAAFATASIGVVDRWVNNAGTAGLRKRPLWELDADDIDQTCRTNLSGSMMLCSEAVRLMLRQPFAAGGNSRYHIFNMGFSRTGVRSSKTAVPHRVSKRAVALLTEFLNGELRSAGIRSIGVHEISPGLVLTDLLTRDTGAREHQVFNAVAEPAETVAAVLVPKIRCVSGSGTQIRFQPIALMLVRLAASVFGYRRGRFFDDAQADGD